MQKNISQPSVGLKCRGNLTHTRTDDNRQRQGGSVSPLWRKSKSMIYFRKGNTLGKLSLCDRMLTLSSRIGHRRCSISTDWI